MDRIRQMQIFVQVVENGSLSRAADVLALSRSTVSTEIQGLEDRMRCQLLHRTTRQVLPTRDGLEFLPVAREIIEAAFAADEMFLQPDHEITGRLRVDMPSRIAREVVIPALPGFLDTQPGLSIELSASDGLTDLVANGVDCVLRVGILESSELISQKLGDLPFVTCASPGYLKRCGTPVTLGDLTLHRIVNYTPRFPARSSYLSFMVDDEQARITLQSAITVDSAEAYIAAALAGLGIIQVPAFDVQKHLAAKALVAILPDHAPPSEPLSFLFIRKRNLSRGVRLFQDWLEHTLREAGALPKSQASATGALRSGQTAQRK